MSSPHEIEQKTDALVIQAAGLSVYNDDSYTRAATFLTTVVKPILKEIAGTFGPIIQAAHRTHQEALAQRKRVEEPVIAAEKVVKGRLGSYREEQERIRREEAAKAEAEARKREEEARLREAAALEEAGETEAADQVLEAPMEVIPAPVAPAVPKVAGISTRYKWSGVLVDLKVLVEAVAQGRAPIALLQVNQVALNEMARAMKSTLAYPGVKAKRESVIGSGSR